MKNKKFEVEKLKRKTNPRNVDLFPALLPIIKKGSTCIMKKMRLIKH
jgi:hypothetical protein